MDYMDLAVGYPRKALKFNHSLTQLFRFTSQKTWNHNMPFVGESTGDWWIKGKYCINISISWRHYG